MYIPGNSPPNLNFLFYFTFPLIIFTFDLRCITIPLRYFFPLSFSSLVRKFVFLGKNGVLAHAFFGPQAGLEMAALRQPGPPTLLGPKWLAKPAAGLRPHLSFPPHVFFCIFFGALSQNGRLKPASDATSSRPKFDKNQFFC